MPSTRHGRCYLPVVVCLAVLLLVVKFQRDLHPEISFPFLKQSSQPDRPVPAAIANSTLGFEKILAINAPWRSERKDLISLAASYTGITLEWIDGINADDIPEKAYPPGNHRTLSRGNLGSWKAHMNALREVIEQNLTTALIFEDDADWDFRIRSQLADFGRSAQKLPSLINQFEPESQKPFDSDDPIALAKRSSLPLTLLTRELKNEPYGRTWDMLWLGHCGAALSPPSNSPDRIIILNDMTVPEPQHLKPTTHSPLDQIGSLYPPHTRVVHRANSTLCTIAYAVTQTSARKLLYELGVRKFDRGYDFALSDWCNGLLRGGIMEWGLPLCVTVQPPIFSHHFAERASSDIMSVGAGGRPEMGTRYVRWSLKMNLEQLVRGGRDMVEQWGDGEGK